DVKSLGNFQESGIAFIDLVAGSDAAIISSNTGLSYNSGTNTLQVDAGGVRFPDGVTQTIAYIGQDSTYTASDGISLNGNNFILNGTGSLDKLTITSGIVFPDGNTQVVAFTGVGVGSATGLSDSIYIDLNNQLSGSGSFKYSGDTAAIDATLTAAAISGQTATTTIADADNFIIERGAALRKVARSVVVTGLATTGELNSVSGYLQGQIDTNTATSGYLQGQIDSNDTDISALQTATGSLDTRVTQNTNDISSVSGLLYNNWNINVTGNVDSITTNQTVVFTGLGLTTVSYDNVANIVSISGAGDGSGQETSPGGSDTYVQFNDGGSFGGDANFTWNTGTATLNVSGSFTATTKSFLIDHPTKEGMKLQYGSLEGPENGVYIRGTTDQPIIQLPDYWVALVDENSITVNLTPVGKFQSLYIIDKNNEHVTVGGVEGSYDYVVYGERKDVDKLEVEWYRYE
ncbi:MAG: hypothetical protein ACXADW_23860, partial [Candidatus Hodarchaeales archaeon]